jgi:enoyl-CoA hydratase
MTRFHDRVTLERRGRVALILLDRPERLNAFDGELYQGLNEALHTFRDDDELWAAVIGSSSSRAFSAGVDIKALNAHAEAGRLQGVGGLDIDGNMFTNKPMIAAVEGHCVGEGVNLALGCDLIIADESAKFAISEIRIGTNPIDIPIKLSKKMGYTKAFAFLNPGTPMDAYWCERAGLVEQVAELGQAQQVALEFAEGLCRDCAPLAVRAQKETLWRAVFESEESAKEQGLEARTAMRKSNDYREGLIAFSEKRSPKFDGN